jgi:lipoate---protein ligase
MTVPLSALWQMQQDQLLIDNLPHQTELSVRFYEWAQPTITYGCFLDPMEYLTAPIPGFEMVKRPTGGGMLFHVQDFPFTVAVPAAHPKFSANVLENYRFVNEAVIRALQEVMGDMPLKLIEKSQDSGFSQFCMATPTRYDIMLQGQKIGVRLSVRRNMALCIRQRSSSKRLHGNF